VCSRNQGDVQGVTEAIAFSRSVIRAATMKRPTKRPAHSAFAAPGLCEHWRKRNPASVRVVDAGGASGPQRLIARGGLLQPANGSEPSESIGWVMVLTWSATHRAGFSLPPDCDEISTPVDLRCLSTRTWLRRTHISVQALSEENSAQVGRVAGSFNVQPARAPMDGTACEVFDRGRDRTQRHAGAALLRRFMWAAGRRDR
jgi:hypothetical protein